VARGEGVIHNGKPAVHGTFIRVKGGLVVLTLVNGRLATFGRMLNGEPLRATSDEVLASEWIYRGSADYDACLNDAAAIEDKINAGGQVENGFNEVVPEVAQRRKVEALAEYTVRDHKLPQPHFPYVIRPDEADNSPVMRLIFDSQKAVVRSFKEPSSAHYAKFVAPGSLDVAHEYRNSAMLHTALIEFAKANGLQLTVADFDGSPAWGLAQIEESVSLDALKSALTGKTEPDIMEQAATFMRGAIPWFDWQDQDPASDYLPQSFRRAIEEAVRQSLGDAAPALSPTDVVGIKGNTRTWKETIKDCANKAGHGKFKWDKDALVWNVYRSTWDYLTANHVNAAKQLELTDATLSL
jgi:hypothetical protein